MTNEKIFLNVNQTAGVLGVPEYMVREGIIDGLVELRTQGGHRRFELNNVLDVKSVLKTDREVVK